MMLTPGAVWVHTQFLFSIIPELHYLSHSLSVACQGSVTQSLDGELQKKKKKKKIEGSKPDVFY